MKPKTAFESGNSPPKASESGAPIQTGRGLEDVARHIQSQFAILHQNQPAPEKREKQPRIYTEAHAEKFHQRVKHLVRSASLLDALQSSHFRKSRTNSNVWEIAVPQESAEDLFKAALGEDE